MKIKTPIVLTKDQREKLNQFTKKGIHSVRLVTRAQIILAMDTSKGRKPETLFNIAKRFNVSRQSLDNIRRDFLLVDNISLFLKRKKRETPPVPPKVTGEVEAHIIALACSPLPKGYARWTLKLLAEKSVELQYLEEVSTMTICRLLKKHNLSRT